MLYILKKKILTMRLELKLLKIILKEEKKYYMYPGTSISYDRDRFENNADYIFEPLLVNLNTALSEK